jgi:hypothetical protein
MKSSLQSSDYSLRSEKSASLSFATPHRGYALSEKLDIKVEQIDTKLNASDMMTKALHVPLFHRHRYRIMGPQLPGIDAD